MTDIGNLGGSWIDVLGLNKHGQIVGFGSNQEGNYRAFSWTKQTGMVDLGTLGGPDSIAVAVSDEGQVVGTTTTGTELRAFSWTAADGMVELGSLGGPDSFGVAVNARGDVAGISTTSDFLYHAVVWESAASDRTGRDCARP